MNKLNQEVPMTLYHLAEAKRIYKCKFLDRLHEQIEAIFKDTKNVEDLNDIYYLFLMHKNAKKYGFKPSEAFAKALASKAKDDFLINFNSEDWSYNKSGGKG